MTAEMLAEILTAHGLTVEHLPCTVYARHDGVLVLDCAHIGEWWSLLPVQSGATKEFRAAEREAPALVANWLEYIGFPGVTVEVAA